MVPDRRCDHAERTTRRHADQVGASGNQLTGDRDRAAPPPLSDEYDLRRLEPTSPDTSPLAQPLKQ
ncbi:MAG: hypothetical protein ACRDPW_01450 [Mycobacteriales bacterium]